MDIINPNFLLKENNIFTLRKKEFNDLENKIRIMVQPLLDQGFELEDFGISRRKFLFSEIQNTMKEIFVLKLKKGNYKIDLSMNIPILIDDQYFLISGTKKVPIFQLFDIPIIIRKDIKIRTNVISFSVTETTVWPNIVLKILKKSVPLSLILFA